MCIIVGFNVTALVLRFLETIPVSQPTKLLFFIALDCNLIFQTFLVNESAETFKNLLIQEIIIFKSYVFIYIFYFIYISILHQFYFFVVCSQRDPLSIIFFIDGRYRFDFVVEHYKYLSIALYM